MTIKRCHGTSKSLSDLLRLAGLGKCKPSSSLLQKLLSGWSPQHSLSHFVPSLPCLTASVSPLPPGLFLSLQLRSCQWVTRTERSLLLHFVQQPLHTPKFQEPGYASKMWGNFWVSGYPYEEPEPALRVRASLDYPDMVVHTHSPKIWEAEQEAT